MDDVTQGWLRLAQRSAAAGPTPTRPADVPADRWPRFVGTVVSPLATLVRELLPHIMGISGPPGSGKSTLARSLATAIDRGTVTLSLDDFYLPRDERERRGMAWRGPPGSHDLGSLIEVLEHIRERRAPVSLPRFSHETDDRAEPVKLETAPDLVILEGWYLGYTGGGYGEILDHLDLLVFLDVDEDASRARRFAREALLREAGGGFSEADMQRFWDDVLGPGIQRWSRPAKASADLVLEIDAAGDLRSVHATGGASERIL